VPRCSTAPLDTIIRSDAVQRSAPLPPKTGVGLAYLKQLGVRVNCVGVFGKQCFPATGASSYSSKSVVRRLVAHSFAAAIVTKRSNVLPASKLSPVCYPLIEHGTENGTSPIFIARAWKGTWSKYFTLAMCEASKNSELC